MLPSMPIAHFDIGEVYRRLNARAAASAQRRLERKGLKQMLELEDHMLRDVGVTRYDVEHALLHKSR